MGKLIQIFLSLVALSGAYGAVWQGASVATQQATSPVFESTGNTNVSYNWAGYIANSGTFTSVTGTWVVPYSSGNKLSADTVWVGIGGVSGRDLIQAGSQAVVRNGNQIDYQAWYELLPGDSQLIPITISPGNSLTVSISQQSSGVWLISYANNTTGQSYQTTVNYSSSLSSAEWIVEMPVLSGSFLPLDNFGTVQFSNLSAIKNGISQNLYQAGAAAVTMIDSSGQVLAQPSSLGNIGNSFSVTRIASSTQAVALPSSDSSVTVTVPRGFLFGRKGIQFFMNGHGSKKFILQQESSKSISGSQSFSFDSDSD